MSTQMQIVRVRNRAALVEGVTSGWSAPMR